MPYLNLMTKEKWEKLYPRVQGYVAYVQGGLPGSHLKGVVCPYPAGSVEQKEFAAGEFMAIMDATETKNDN